MQIILFVSSMLIVGFGQPAFSLTFSLLASLFGFALFWKIAIDFPNGKQRFWISTAWFFGVQLIQLSWMISHPFSYIYVVYSSTALIMGLQFGILCFFIKPPQLGNISYLFGLAGLWTMLEWSRLFIFSGFSFNLVGLELTANIYSLQMASVWGIYGLSFWVIFVNLLALRAWLKKQLSYSLIWACAAALPFIYGGIQLKMHQQDFADQAKDMNNKFTAVLVQTAFPIEEIQEFKTQKSMVDYVIDEWRQILKVTQKHLGTQIDLIALPEYTVPYGTYSYVFPHSLVASSFSEIYGPESIFKLPKLEEPLAAPVKTAIGTLWMVSNAYWAQAMANIFNADVIAGLEDAEDLANGERKYYSSAIHFKPGMDTGPDYHVNRYEKRVLVPMGEYIPSNFLKKLAQSYGIHGSFTPGREAKVFDVKKLIGLSICYEETFSDIMHENKAKGAELLLNLTSDVWYPFSRLMQQHFDHARPRTVENGIPLLRSCNTGITGAIDSLGRVVSVLGDPPEKVEWVADSLKVEVPTYTYRTLYSHVGDKLILGISVIAIMLGLYFRNFKVDS